MSEIKIGDKVYFGRVEVAEATILQEFERQYMVEFNDASIGYWKKDGVCATKNECMDKLITVLQGANDAVPVESEITADVAIEPPAVPVVIEGEIVDAGASA